MVDRYSLSPDIVVEAEGAAVIHRGSVLYADGSLLRRMPLELDELIALAQARLTRTLTAEECATYGIADCEASGG